MYHILILCQAKDSLIISMLPGYIVRNSSFPTNVHGEAFTFFYRFRAERDYIILVKNVILCPPLAEVSQRDGGG